MTTANRTVQFLQAIVTGWVADSALAAARAITGGLAVAAAEAADRIAVQKGREAMRYENDKEADSLAQQITIAGLQQEFQEEQEVVALKNLVRQIPTAEIEIQMAYETIRDAVGQYEAALGRGMRLWDQRTTFRRRTANDISEHRYRDMAFRVFRNDALQKYDAQFDQAARYVYLTAKAYDYETNLLGSDGPAGQRFLTDIVKQRSIGVINGGLPYAGNGLAGTMAELAANFEVLRAELGFNNKDKFTRTFSIRREAEGIEPSTLYHGAWRTRLNSYKIADLNDLAVYRQYCQPLLPARDPEPALVIPFSTSLESGLNLFGRPSKGDETLPPDRYAIKVHSFHVEFKFNYAADLLNRHVNVYLVPAGTDRMRVPTDGSVRDWQVIDQTLPVPFPVSAAELQQPDWMPWDALLGGGSAAAHRRGIPTVPACPPNVEICDDSYALIGRSLWNTQWYLIIPGSQLMGEDPDMGIAHFINGTTGIEPGIGVNDIELTISSYGYTGNVQLAVE